MAFHNDRPVIVARCPRRPACIAMADGVSVETRLRELLDWLQFWKHGDENVLQPRASINDGDNTSAGVLSQDGPLGWLKFWQRNDDNARRTGEQLRDFGESLKSGDLDVVKEKASGIDFSWLFPKKKPTVTEEIIPAPAPTLSTEFVEIEKRMAAVGAFFAESLCPWDYDRRELSLTFVNSWTDVQTSSVAPPEQSLVKVTSTIKPLYQEWKLSARTKLMELGKGGIVFGKAGLFLAGEAPAYVGLEADRLIDVPRLGSTKLFANVNYRSSRKPFATPVVASMGVQQTIPLGKRLEFTFRLGYSTKNSMHPFFATPVPYGTYF